LQWSVSVAGSNAFLDVDNHTLTNVLEGTPVYVQIRPVTDGTVLFDQWKVLYGASPADNHIEMTPANVNVRYTFNNGNPVQSEGTHIYTVTRLILYRNGIQVSECTFKDSTYQHTVVITDVQTPDPVPAIAIREIADMCKDAVSFDIPFDRLTSEGMEYNILFSNDAKNAGFVDIVDFQPMPVDHITVPVFGPVIPGHYHGTVYLHFAGTPNLIDAYPFVFDVLSSVEILRHPQSVTEVCQRDSFNLSVEATGENLTYQWYLNNHPIPGAIATNYGSMLTSDKEGTYFVVVSGTCGTQKSTDAQVSMSDLPTGDITVSHTDITLGEKTQIIISFPDDGPWNFTYMVGDSTVKVENYNSEGILQMLLQQQ
jgi:hypothetical protein